MPSRTKLTFYGGVNEIGGNKILLDDGQTRIFLDFGKSFSSRTKYYDWTDTPRFLASGLRDFLTLGIIPDIPGIYRSDLLALDGRTEKEKRSVDGVLVSHAHADHLDHVSFLREDIPIWMGETAMKITKSLEDERNSSVEFEITKFKKRPSEKSAPLIERKVNTFNTEKGEFPIGSIRIEPVHVDHSVPGSYGFIIRTKNATIVYSGDLRIHGNRKDLTEDFIRKASEARPDMMICEGTRIAEASRQTESDVFEACKFYAEQAKESIIIADYSYKDVDRFTTFYKIAKATSRRLLLNTKTARYIEALSDSNPRISLPALGDDNIGIYMPMKSGGYEEGSYDREDRDYYQKENVWTAADVKNRQKEVILTLGSLNTGELVDIDPNGGLYIHSMSEPFKEEGEIDEERTRRWMEKFRLQWVHSHCSGHASGVDLNKIVNAIRPKAVIPVHTESAGLFGVLQKDIVRYAEAGSTIEF